MCLPLRILFFSNLNIPYVQCHHWIKDIWLSSKSRIWDIKYAISTIRMQILNQLFRKKIHYILIISVPSFHQPARSSSFFVAFCLQLYGKLFMDDPISSVGTWLLRSSHLITQWFKTQWKWECNLNTGSANKAQCCVISRLYSGRCKRKFAENNKSNHAKLRNQKEKCRQIVSDQKVIFQT